MSDQSSWQVWSAATPVRQLAIADFNGDGVLDLLAVDHDGFTVLDPEGSRVLTRADVAGITTALPLTLDPASGPAIVAANTTGVWLWSPGTGRHPFMAVEASGRSESDQMRSNASGIGTNVRVRVAGQWTVFDTIDSHSGPGQSLAPFSIGLHGRTRADFVALQWSDGVTQTEIGLAVGEANGNTARIEVDIRTVNDVAVQDFKKKALKFVGDGLCVGTYGGIDQGLMEGAVIRVWRFNQHFAQFCFARCTQVLACPN